MDALTEALVRLLNRQEATDRRLKRIEELLAIQNGAAPEPRPAPAPPAVETEPVPEPVAAAPSTPPAEETPLPQAPHHAPPRELETQVGLTWVNRIGALTFVLAVAFFFKLAVENEWIGEAGRVILGTLAGFLTIGAAEQFFRRNHQLYTQGVCATGIGILYLSFYASFGFYQLVPAGFAFVLMASAVAMAGVLALRYSSQAILVLALMAGYATPVLLSTGQDRPYVFFSYLFLLNAAALLAARSREWIFTEVFAGLSTWFLFLVWFTDRYNEEKRIPAVVFAALFYGLFATSPVWILTAVSQLAAAAAIAGIWVNQATPFILASALLAASGLVIAARRSSAWTANIALIAFICGYLIWTDDATRDSRQFGLLFPGLTVIFLMFFLWLPWRVLKNPESAGSTDYWLAAANSAFYFSAAYELADATGYDGYMGLLAIVLAALHLALGYRLWQGRESDAAQSTPALLAAGLAMCFATLAIPIQFSGATITVAWAVEVGAAAWLAARTGSRRLVWIAAVLFLLTSGRLLLFDADMYGYQSAHAIITNSRFLAFAVSAVAFGAAAWWLKPKPIAGLIAIGGHAALLAGIMLELGDWTLGNIGPESLQSVRSALHSLVLAGYGVLLIAVGVAYRVRFHRAIGLALIAFVIMKLYLYDVWSLLLLWRVIAFAALGALLLLTSYFYSRHRNKIEALWNQQDGDSRS